jgi:16S rRNA (uracil1498-N3)-methyltransferase
MRLTRIHLVGPLQAGSRRRLDPKTGLHLTRVLRLRVGARVAAFDGCGLEHDAEIASVAADQIDILIGSERPTPPPSPLSITLAQGISRGERMDYAIQKATELGVARIVPLLCERTVVRLDKTQADRKIEHWRGVTIAASEQCGRADLPAIEAPVTLLEYLARRGAPSHLSLVLDPSAGAGLSQLRDPAGAVELLIGPEGGLSDTELGLAQRVGFQGLRLGPRVLRTETAAAAAIAVLQAMHGDLG